jgi:RNA polymerase sigma-70 factor (ECF subfamily)
MSEHEPAISSQTSGSTSRTLLQGLRANEAAAWDRLVTLYAPLVYHWCRQQGLPHAEMADLFQDVFQSVAVHIGRFRKERPGDTFRGWLRTITRNKVSDHFRKRALQPQAAGGTTAYLQIGRVAAPSSSIAESQMASEAIAQRELLQRALGLIQGEFEERTWQAFWQTAIENRPSADVAEELSTSVGAVRVAKCRVLRRLREELGESP